MKTIGDLKVEGKRVLVRCDFNTPINEFGGIQDDFRIRQALPTIEYLLARKAKVIIITHVDNPGGRVVEHLSVTRIAKRLSELLERKVQTTTDCIGDETERIVGEMKEGEVVVLENVRFHKEETDNDPEFAKQLARLGDLFVNNAFGVLHREHASVVGIPKILNSVAGLLVLKEVEMLGKVKDNPIRPFVVLMGGSKADNKLSFINKISEVADVVLGGSLLAKKVQEQGMEFTNANKIFWAFDGIGGEEPGADIGFETRKMFGEKIEGAGTILWAGPMGKVEDERYDEGSLEVVRMVQESGAYSVIGGGHLNAFIGMNNLRDSFSYCSTGGGSMLAFLSGTPLPGLEALN